jgi:hypothetical protein
MPGPFTILARVDCWEATLNRQQPHSCHCIGAGPAQRLMQDVSIRVGEAEVAFPAGSCDDTFGGGNAAGMVRGYLSTRCSFS